MKKGKFCVQGVPIYRTGAFAGLFGDAFIKNTNLEGGVTSPAIRVTLACARKLFAKSGGELCGNSESSKIGDGDAEEEENKNGVTVDTFGLNAADVQKLEDIFKDFEVAADLGEPSAGKGDKGPNERGHEGLEHFLASFLKRVENLQVKKRMVFGGGWNDTSGGHAIMHIIERTDEKTYAFVTCNTGEGVEYHPSNRSDYPKTKSRTAIRVPNIPKERMLDEAVWYLLFKQMRLRRKENGPKVFYEVVLPHLAGSHLSQAVSDSKLLNGEFETVQRSGTCFFRCILSAFRYMMKCDGFDRVARKKVTLMLRYAFLEQIERDLMEFEYVKDFNESDLFMIQMACGQTALAAAKLVNSTKNPGATPVIRLDNLKQIRTQVASIKSAARALEPKAFVPVEDAPLRLEPFAKLKPFRGFECLATHHESVEKFAGSLTEAVPEMFVDLQPPKRVPSSFGQLVHVLARLHDRCDKLRAKTSVTAMSLSVHQLCALVQDVVCSGTLPLPGGSGRFGKESAGLWHDATSKGIKSQQRLEALEHLHAVAVHYVAAAFTMESDHAQFSARAICMSAIMTVFDAVVRLETTDTPSILSDLLAARSSASIEERKRKTEEKEQKKSGGGLSGKDDVGKEKKKGDDESSLADRKRVKCAAARSNIHESEKGGESSSSSGHSKSRVTVVSDSIKFIYSLPKDQEKVFVVDFKSSSSSSGEEDSNQRLAKMSASLEHVDFFAVEKSRELCSTFKVTSYPTLLVRKGDNELARTSTTSLEEIRKLILTHAPVLAKSSEKDGSSDDGGADKSSASSSSSSSKIKETDTIPGSKEKEDEASGGKSSKESETGGDDGGGDKNDDEETSKHWTTHLFSHKGNNLLNGDFDFAPDRYAATRRKRCVCLYFDAKENSLEKDFFLPILTRFCAATEGVGVVYVSQIDAHCSGKERFVAIQKSLPSTFATIRFENQVERSNLAKHFDVQSVAPCVVVLDGSSGDVLSFQGHVGIGLAAARKGGSTSSMDVVDAWVGGKDVPDSVMRRMKSIRLNYQSFRDVGFEELSDEMILHNPRLAVARSAVLRWIDSFGGVSDENEIFKFAPMPTRDGRRDTFSLKDTGNELVLVQLILEHLEKDFSLPNQDRRRGALRHQNFHAPEATPDVERKALWFSATASWKDTVPEFPWLRDMIVLQKIMLEPHNAFVANNPWLENRFVVFPSDVIANWVWEGSDSDHKQAYLRIVMLDDQKKVSLGSTKPVSPASTDHLLKRRNVIEDDVLHNLHLPSFDDQLSVENAERLLSYMTAPYLCVPMFLAFFAEKDLTGTLMNAKLRHLLESVLFEPKAFCVDTQMPTSVPVVGSRRDKILGTPFGLLAHEMEHSADSVLGPLATICRNSLKLCVGQYCRYSSKFVDLLLFVVRVGVRVLDYYRFYQGSLDEMDDDQEEERRHATNLAQILQGSIAMLLTRWINDSETANDVERALQLHAHLAMVRSMFTRASVESSATTEDDAGDDTVEFFVKSAAYVVGWHSKGQSEGEKKGDGKHRHFQQRPRAGQVNIVASTDRPIHAAFEALQRVRPLVLDWFDALQRANPDRFDATLTDIVSVAMRRSPLSDAAAATVEDADGGGTKTTRARVAKSDTATAGAGWQNVSKRSTMCSRTIESEHPYKPSTDFYETVHFPGAKYISIHFDECTHTELNSDILTIYKSESYTDYWGEPYSGTAVGQTGWPGAGGRAPLVVPGDTFCVHFHSDATKEEWGFKLTAYAPISESAEQALSVELKTVLADSDERTRVEMIRRGLKFSGNRVGPAKAYVKENKAKLLEDIAAERLREREEAKEDARKTNDSASRGFYIHPRGSVQLNVQTAEVCFGERMKMPTPPDIASAPDFREVFDGVPYCNVVAKTEHRRHIQIDQGRRQYSVMAWTPLRAITSLSMGSLEGSSNDDESEGKRAGGGGKEEEKIRDEGDKKAVLRLMRSHQLGGLPDAPCLGMPRRGDGVENMVFMGATFNPYVSQEGAAKEGDEKRMLRMFDKVLAEASKAAKIDEVPLLWIRASDDSKKAKVAGRGSAEVEDAALSAKIDTLVSMFGTSRKRARAGLLLAGGDVNAAANLILTNEVPRDDDEEEKKSSKTDTSEVASEDASETSSETRILMYVPPQGDIEETKGHPGQFYLVIGREYSSECDGDASIFLRVDALVDEGRHIQRRVVYVSDSRYALRHMPNDTEDRDLPFASGLRYAAGYVFNQLLSKEGKLLRRAGVGLLKEMKVGSLVITRSRQGHVPASETVMRESEKRGSSAWWWVEDVGAAVEDGGGKEKREMDTPDLEVFVPSRLLSGVIPEVLTEQYTFWRTGKLTLCGYSTCKDSEHTTLRVKMSRVGTRWVAIVRRFDERSYEDAATRIQIVSSGRGENEGAGSKMSDEEVDPIKLVEGVRTMPSMLLMNLAEARGGVLGRLGTLLTRLDNLSHVLVWSDSRGDVDDACPLSLVEIPRLRLRFRVSGSQIRSMDYDGWLVSDDGGPESVRKYAKGLSQALVLENSRGEHALLVPNYTPLPIPIKSCPFSTALSFDRSRNWHKNVHSRQYMYPIHLSGSFCVTKSLASALYLVAMRLFDRQYESAARLIGTCFTDTALSEEETWAMGLVAGTKEDHHPDAHACRLRLALICREVSTKPAWDVDADAKGYLQKYAHVSAVCRLSPGEEMRVLPSKHMSYVSLVEAASKAKSGTFLEAPVGLPNPPVNGGNLVRKGTFILSRALSKMCPQAIAGQNIMQKFSYIRPSHTAQQGAGALGTLRDFWEDSVLKGRRHKLGFLFLYDMLMGRVSVDIARPSGGWKDRSASSTEGDAASKANEDVGKASNTTTSSAATAASANTDIDEKEEGRVTLPTGDRHWVLAKLLAQAKLVATLKELEDTRGRSHTANEDILGLALLWPVLFAKERSSTGSPIPLTFPSIPYARNFGKFNEGVMSNFGQVDTFTKRVLMEAHKLATDATISKAWLASYASVPSDKNTGSDKMRVYAGTSMLLRPLTSDCALSTRTLTTQSGGVLDDDGQSCLPTAKDIEAFAGAPLSSVATSSVDVATNDDRFSTKVDDTVDDTVPFDLSENSVSKTKAAKDMLARFEADMKASAKIRLQKKHARLKCLGDRLVVKIREGVKRAVATSSSSLNASGAAKVIDAADGGDGVPPMPPRLTLRRTVSKSVSGELEGTLRSLKQLRSELENLHRDESKKMSDSVKLLDKLSNDIGPPRDQTISRVEFDLRRESGQRARTWFELLAGILLSSKGLDDLRVTNPFIDEQSFDMISHLTTSVLMRCVRISQVNQCTSLVSKLDRYIRDLLYERMIVEMESSSDTSWARETVSASMVSSALRSHGYDEGKARSALKAMAQTVHDAMKTSATTSTSVAGKLRAAATAAIACHVCNFDAEKTRLCLKTAKNRRQFRRVAQRGCYFTDDASSLSGLSISSQRAAKLALLTVAPAENDETGSKTSILLHKASSLDAMVHVIQHTSEALASSLTARRWFTTTTSSDESESSEGVKTKKEASTTKSSTLSWKFDPRFLVLEFLKGWLLRRRQVELVQDFMSAASKRKSAVHQMIMGAGKTTVICPMLSLMLADGDTLVTQVVPAALLDMSRSVLRECFSNVVAKRVYTLFFDRAGPLPRDDRTSGSGSSFIIAIRKLQQKLVRAKQSRALVCTTPGAVKSLMLKYIDLLQSVEAASPVLFCPREMLGQQRKKSERLANELRSNAVAADALENILAMWDARSGGVALLDEVDLLLHPLRSELNFPIGHRSALDMTIPGVDEKFVVGARWNLPVHLLDAIFYKQYGRLSTGHIGDSGRLKRAHDLLSKISDALDAGVRSLAMTRIPHVVLLKKTYYETDLKHLFARWAIMWLLHQPAIEFACANAVEKSTRVPIKWNSATFRDANGDDSTVSPRQLEELLFAYIAPSVSLNLASQWIAVFLPHVLSKICRVSYGLLHTEDFERWATQENVPVERVKEKMPLSRQLMAVPFSGKDVPSRASEFAHPEILLGLSILAYRHNGIRASDMRMVIVDLKKRMMREPGAFRERPSWLLFDQWIQSARLAADLGAKENDKKGDDSSGSSSSSKGAPAIAATEVYSLDLFQPSETEQIESAHGLLSRLPEVVHYYLTRHVFKRVMRHQSMKLQASGVDLGGDVLFGTRLGFSGTANDLLPRELRPCHYERGSEAQIIRVLSSQKFCSHELISKWSVCGLLDRIARCKSPRFHALIDTGALITGISNEGVARYLLQSGLKGMDACVFLDSLDRKMVVDRSARKPVPLNRCGVSISRRFTFYDQIHTTGMDIKQPLDACAAATLGKDMTLRDHAQGCYRMRQLARGQTLHIFVVDEVNELIDEACGTKKHATNRLVDIVAWLTLNSMKSEKMQFAALSEQNVASVWRKEALDALRSTRAPAGVRGVVGPLLTTRFGVVPENVEEAEALLKEHSVLSKKELDDIRAHKEQADAKERLSEVLSRCKVRGDLVHPAFYQTLVAAANQAFEATKDSRKALAAVVGLLQNAKIEPAALFEHPASTKTLTDAEEAEVKKVLEVLPHVSRRTVIERLVANEWKHQKAVMNLFSIPPDLAKEAEVKKEEAKSAELALLSVLLSKREGGDDASDKVVWQWRDGAQWRPYLPSDAVALERGFSEGKDVIVLNNRFGQYTVVLVAPMSQTKTATGFKRDVRRLGPKKKKVAASKTESVGSQLGFTIDVNFTYADKSRKDTMVKGFKIMSSHQIVTDFLHTLRGVFMLPPGTRLRVVRDGVALKETDKDKNSLTLADNGIKDKSCGPLVVEIISTVESSSAPTTTPAPPVSVPGLKRTLSHLSENERNAKETLSSSDAKNDTARGCGSTGGAETGASKIDESGASRSAGDGGGGSKAKDGGDGGISKEKDDEGDSADEDDASALETALALSLDSEPATNATTTGEGDDELAGVRLDGIDDSVSQKVLNGLYTRLAGVRHNDCPVYMFTGENPYNLDDVCLFYDINGGGVWRVASKRWHMDAKKDVSYLISVTRGSKSVPLGDDSQWALWKDGKWAPLANAKAARVEASEANKALEAKKERVLAAQKECDSICGFIISGIAGPANHDDMNGPYIRVGGNMKVNGAYVYQYAGDRSTVFGFKDLCIYRDPRGWWRACSQENHMSKQSDTCFLLGLHPDGPTMHPASKGVVWKIFNATKKTWDVCAGASIAKLGEKDVAKIEKERQAKQEEMKKDAESLAGVTISGITGHAGQEKMNGKYMKMPGVRINNRAVYMLEGNTKVLGHDDLCLFADSDGNWRIGSKSEHADSDSKSCYILSSNSEGLTPIGDKIEWKVWNGSTWAPLWSTEVTPIRDTSMSGVDDGSKTNEDDDAANAARWQWKDQTGWRDYEDSDALVLETAFDAGLPECVVVNDFGSYRVTLIEPMMQTKMKSGFQRPVQRLASKNAGAASSTPAASKKSEGGEEKGVDKQRLVACVKLFREQLDTLVLSEEIPRRWSFVDRLERRASAYKSFLSTQGNGVVTSLLKELHSFEDKEMEGDGNEIDAEVVQEQEEEKEEHVELQVQQHTTPKYDEKRGANVIWRPELLRSAKIMLPSTFYALSTLKLPTHKRESKTKISIVKSKTVALDFPGYMLLSENYTPSVHRADLTRRLKNASVLLDWIPDELMETSSAAGDKKESAATPTPIKRYCVVLSLAEAESLRRYVQLQRKTRARSDRTRLALCTLGGLWLTQKHTDECQDLSNVAVKTGEDRGRMEADMKKRTLRIFDQLRGAGQDPTSAAANAMLMASQQIMASENAKSVPNTFGAARQLARFFNCNTSFDEGGVIALLRCLQLSAQSKRRAYFEETLLRRRRDNVNWEDTSIKLAFAHQDAAHLIRMQELALRVHVAIVRKYKSMLVAFRSFDVSGNQVLTHQELRNAIASLDVSLPETAVAELVAHSDADNNGVLTYREFVAQFSAGIDKDVSSSERGDEDMKRHILESGTKFGAAAVSPVSSLSPTFALSAPTASVLASATKREHVSNAALTIAELPSLGRLILVGGGRVTSRDGVVATSPGHRPTIAPRGLLLKRPGTRCYFEIEVVTRGRGCVGFYDRSYAGDSDAASGIGDDEHSWGFDGFAKECRNASKSKEYGFPWSSGDVIGCLLSIESEGTAAISYWLNGTPMGVAFEHIKFEGGLVPAVSFDRCLQFRFNSGRLPFRHVQPAGAHSVSYFVRRIMSASVVAAGSAGFGHMKTTTGTSNMEIKPGVCPVITVGQEGFPTCLLQGCLLTHGKWYYEFTLRVKSSGWGAVSQIGWADVGFIGHSRYGQGIGDDKHSWGFDGHRICMWYNCNQQRWGKDFKVRDVIGCCCDVDERALRYSHNGSFASPMGIAVKNMEITGGVTPGFTIKSCEISVNLGFAPFANNPPPGYLPIALWLHQHRPVGATLPPIPPSVLKSAGASQATMLPPPSALRKTMSMRTQPIKGLKRATMRASSGPFAILNDRHNNIVGATGNYPSAVLDQLPLINSGVWYYEVRVTSDSSASDSSGRFSLGWATRAFFGDSGASKGVGDDENSWGFSFGKPDELKIAGKTKSISGNEITKNAHTILRKGTGLVVGCTVNVTEKWMHFKMNEDMVAFKVPMGNNVPTEGVRPALSLTKGFQLSVNFGENAFAYPPRYPFASVHDLLLHLQSGKKGFPEPMTRVVSEDTKNRTDESATSTVGVDADADDEIAKGVPLTTFYDIKSIEDAVKSLTETHGDDEDLGELLARLGRTTAEIKQRVNAVHSEGGGGGASR
eukprot:g1539.t1